MSKTLTGVEYTPQEFRNLNKCVACGRASKIISGEKCNECDKKPFTFCRVCGIETRIGAKTCYTYDNKVDYRSNVDFKINKKDIREFEYNLEPFCAAESEDMCACCKDFEKKIKHRCWVCGVVFENSPENYITNGNTCSDCSEPFVFIDIHVEKTTNN